MTAVVARARGIHRSDTDRVYEGRPARRRRLGDGHEDDAENREDERGDLVRHAPPARLDLHEAFAVFGVVHHPSLPSPTIRTRHSRLTDTEPAVWDSCQLASTCGRSARWMITDDR